MLHMFADAVADNWLYTTLWSYAALNGNSLGVHTVHMCSSVCLTTYKLTSPQQNGQLLPKQPYLSSHMHVLQCLLH